MLIDTHAHVNFNAFKDESEKIIKKTLAKNVWMINVGSQFDTSKRAIDIAKNYMEGVYAAVGLHPIHLEEGEVDEEEDIHFKTKKEEFNKATYGLLATQPKVVAIGETGLDFYHIEGFEQSVKTIRTKQKKVFKEHLELAQKVNKPLILHCRGSKEDPLDAYREILEMLKEAISDKQYALRGVIHCFSADLEIAKKFIDLGFLIGFTGIITFEKATKIQEVVKNLPLEKILIETDAPYLAPEPHRGKKNEPLYVEFIAGKIADIKKIDFLKVAKVTTANAKELFGI